MKVVLLYFVMLCGVMTLSAQQTVTITASKDNTLYQDSEGLVSNGAGTYLFAGRTNQATNNLRRPVVKFDFVGKLPENAVLLSAKLKMNLSKTITGASNVNVHKLLADWGEGTSDASANEGSGASAALNDATWLYKFFSTQNWSKPGGDYSPEPSATKLVGDVVGLVEWSDTLLLSNVKAWVLAPETNFGWILIGNEASQSSKRFDSRTIASAANRPQLVLQYTVPNVVHSGSTSPYIFSLKQNFPNPFNPSTTISYSLPQNGLVTIKFFDVLGNEIKTIVNQNISAGEHLVSFDGKNLTSGIYFYRLQSGNQVATKKLMLLK